MAYLSPALRQPPLPDGEKKRLRELSRFYCTIPQHYPLAEDVSTPTPNDADNAKEPGLNVAQLSSDITLTALTQLGVYRFGCMRSYVSLIDGQSQHIISEATASISLRDRKKHRPDDGLYLGVTTLDLVFGVCPHAVKLFSGHEVPHLQNTDNVTATSTRYIVRDFTLEEYFKERPYVTDWPYFRFYAEVPLYSPSGHILGSYCVVDNKPRMGFNEDDVIALQEISDAIALHLENVRTVHYHDRSDRLVRGLTSFVKDRPDHRNLLDTPASSRRTSGPEPETLPLSKLSLSTDPTGGTSPLFSNKEGGDVDTDATSLSVALYPPVESPVKNGGVNSPRETVFFQGKEGSSGNSTPLMEAKESVPLSIRIANVFAHASAVIQRSMDVDGVLFIDASGCNSGIVRSSLDSFEWESLPKNADPNPSSYRAPGSPYHGLPCDTLGLALNEEGIQHGISDGVLRELITALPHGGVLHPDTLSADSSLENKLAQSFPQAKSLLFIPLWDWNKGQWLAGTFVWTKDSDQERDLGMDELHYFKVFGDSIISEIARLDWSQKEKSKFDLISSVSHELRSPLHGMLANAELLAASLVDPEQRETVKALETCGITLLDTMNHLLDFAKINNLASVNQGASSVTSLVSSFYLDVLMEEVVNSVFSGMRHAAIASTPTTSPILASRTYKPDLSVILRFEGQQHWKVTSMTGAWRRIVMNILGNALKYTDRGFIEISASLINPPQDPHSVVAHLRFADSGQGMSQEFLRNKLFSPFAQEDSLSEGAGLGMSIVKQLVTFLKGSIDVKSEIGAGTQVDIFIPVQPEPVLADLSAEKEVNLERRNICLVGLGAYPELSEEPTGTLSPTAKRKICLQSFLSNLLSEQAGWTVSSAESLDDVNSEVAIIDEATLKKFDDNGALRRHTETKFVCLCDGAPGSNTHGIGAQVLRIYQPFSPRKVLQSLERAVKGNSKPLVPRPELPRAPHLSLATDVDKSIVANGTPAPSDPTVLIVDDNEINIKVLAKLISKLGFHYTTATNGLLALNAYKSSPGGFRVVLMDVSMPVMDGIDAAKHMRRHEQKNSLPPVRIYAVTGIASAAMQQEALMAGVDEYLVKPLSLQQLGKLIKPYL
ncbi:hypothetical protein BDV18DRAFT_146716 [Aspergillus unguis]